MPSDDQTPPPTMILLPGGWCISGVALWAARLASELADRGGRVTVVTFRPPHEARPLEIDIDPRVRVLELAHLEPIESCAGQIEAYMPAITREIVEMSATGPVCVLPNQHGDCFGIGAALAVTLPDRVRVIGTAHSDNAYDLRLLTHYEPAITTLVGVSEVLTKKIAEALPSRSRNATHIPYGVPIPDEEAAPSPHDQPLRLIYTGRFEHRQKRVLALPALSSHLTQLGIEHELTIVGDGPARGELERACSGNSAITILPPASPDGVRTLLQSHDAFVLPSRFEGLSIAMLEALGAGCVPIVARVESGASEAIEHAQTGLIADVSPDADENETARALAMLIAQHSRDDLRRMRAGAIAAARERYSLHAHADAWERVLHSAVESEPKSWPATRPCAFSGSGAGSGSVPKNASAVLRRTLAGLVGRPLIIHGAGRHTIELAPLLAHADVRAITDDDPARFGDKLFGWKIIDPHSAGMTGATDVIISSQMHEASIWDRRGVYEEQGLRVHRLYAAAQVETKPRRAASVISP